MICAVIAFGFFFFGALIFLDIMWWNPPTSIKDGIIRNLEGYLAMIIGYLLLSF